eukprot:4319143-Amphidinium_carterae.1
MKEKASKCYPDSRAQLRIYLSTAGLPEQSDMTKIYSTMESNEGFQSQKNHKSFWKVPVADALQLPL